MMFTVSLSKWPACVAMALAVLPAFASAQNSLGTPPPLEAFGNLPEIDHVDLSPDGGHTAMVVTRKGNRFLVALDLLTEKTVAQPLSDIRVRNVFWVGNEHVALVKSWTSTQNSYSIFRNDVFSVNLQEMKSGKSRQLFNGMDSEGLDPIVTGDLHIIEDGTDYRVSASTYRASNEGSYLLYSFGAKDNQIKQIDVAPSDVINWAIGRDGKPIARSQYDYNRKVWRLAMREGHNWVEKLSLPADTDIPQIKGVGRDGQSVVIFQEATGLQEISPDGEATMLEGGLYFSPLFHPTTGRFNGIAHYDGWVSYTFLDPFMSGLPASIAKAFPEYRIRFEAFAQNPRRMIIYGESPADAGSYTYLNLDSGDALLIGSTYPDIPNAWVSNKQSIRYTAADGLEIEAYLTLPPGREAKSLPLIVLPHGGPEARDDLSFDWDVAAYASRGYAVLQPNFRGSAGYGKAFVEAGYNEFGRKMQSDLSDGVRYLAQQGVISPDRVCIIGYSYGGYAALAGAAFDGNTYRCAASYSGVTDLTGFISYISSKTYSEKSSSALYWKRFLGPESNWDAVSPARNVASVSIPILLIHGKDDTIVPFAQATMMRDALQAAGKNLEFMELKGEDHHLSRGETRLKMLYAMVRFIERNNPAY